MTNPKVYIICDALDLRTLAVPLDPLLEDEVEVVAVDVEHALPQMSGMAESVVVHVYWPLVVQTNELSQVAARLLYDTPLGAQQVPETQNQSSIPEHANGAAVVELVEKDILAVALQGDTDPAFANSTGRQK